MAVSNLDINCGPVTSKMADSEDNSAKVSRFFRCDAQAESAADEGRADISTGTV